MELEVAQWHNTPQVQAKLDGHGAQSAKVQSEFAAATT